MGDRYQTVGLCGSFRKHMREINEAHRLFTASGFTVLAPAEISKVINPGSEFVLLESDRSTNPRDLEARYQGELLKSDVVLVCNPGGYTGGSVMMELGRLVGRADVYFTEEPQEPVVREMAMHAIYSPEELIGMMTDHNKTFDMRDWPDADRLHMSNFSLNTS